MSDSLDIASPRPARSMCVSLTTPSGLQSIDALRRRRCIVFALNLATYAALLIVAWRILGIGGSGGFRVVDLVLLLCFARLLCISKFAKARRGGITESYGYRFWTCSTA